MRTLIIIALLCTAFPLLTFGAYKNSNVYIEAAVSHTFTEVSYNSGNKQTINPLKYDIFLGYSFTSNFRWDLEYTVLQTVHFNDSEGKKYNYNANAIFANVYFDFWNKEISIISPFVGLGAGIGSTNLSSRDISHGRTSNVAWQLFLGAHGNILETLIISIKYSYTAMPQMESTLAIADFNSPIQAIGLSISLLM
jgi:opacity protein-like surface antigen